MYSSPDIDTGSLIRQAMNEVAQSADHTFSTSYRQPILPNSQENHNFTERNQAVLEHPSESQTNDNPDQEMQDVQISGTDRITNYITSPFEHPLQTGFVR